MYIAEVLSGVSKIWTPTLGEITLKEAALLYILHIEEQLLCNLDGIEIFAFHSPPKG